MLEYYQCDDQGYGEDDFIEENVVLFERYWFMGPRLAVRDFGCLDFPTMHNAFVYLMHSVSDTELILASGEIGHQKRSPSVCEIAGGEARCSKILIKHRVATGRNFDIACGSDLTIASEQRAFMNYRKMFHVQVVIMAPICGPFGV